MDTWQYWAEMNEIMHRIKELEVRATKDCVLSSTMNDIHGLEILVESLIEQERKRNGNSNNDCDTRRNTSEQYSASENQVRDS